MKQNILANTNQKKTGGTVFFLDRAEFKVRKFIRDKEGIRGQFSKKI